MKNISCPCLPFKFIVDFSSSSSEAWRCKIIPAFQKEYIVYDLSAERMVGHRHILLLLLDTPKIGIVSTEKKSLWYVSVYWKIVGLSHINYSYLILVQSIFYFRKRTCTIFFPIRPLLPTYKLYLYVFARAKKLSYGTKPI